MRNQSAHSHSSSKQHEQQTHLQLFQQHQQLLQQRRLFSSINAASPNISLSSLIFDDVQMKKNERKSLLPGTFMRNSPQKHRSTQLARLPISKEVSHIAQLDEQIEQTSAILQNSQSFLSTAVSSPIPALRTSATSTRRGSLIQGNLPKTPSRLTNDITLNPLTQLTSSTPLITLTQSTAAQGTTGIIEQQVPDIASSSQNLEEQQQSFTQQQQYFLGPQSQALNGSQMSSVQSYASNGEKSTQPKQCVVHQFYNTTRKRQLTMDQSSFSRDWSQGASVNTPNSLSSTPTSQYQSQYRHSTENNSRSWEKPLHNLLHQRQVTSSRTHSSTQVPGQSPNKQQNCIGSQVATTSGGVPYLLSLSPSIPQGYQKHILSPSMPSAYSTLEDSNSRTLLQCISETKGVQPPQSPFKRYRAVTPLITITNPTITTPLSAGAGGQFRRVKTNSSAQQVQQQTASQYSSKLKGTGLDKVTVLPFQTQSSQQQPVKKQPKNPKTDHSKGFPYVVKFSGVDFAIDEVQFNESSLQSWSSFSEDSNKYFNTDI